MTLHIGGNDVTAPIIQACATPPVDDAACDATIRGSFAVETLRLD